MRPEVKNFLEKLVAGYANLDIKVKAFVLFGSQARNAATLSSDIDIAVVMQDTLSPRERGIIMSLPSEINPDFEVDFFFTTPDALEHAKGVFDPNYHIVKEGVILWEKSAMRNTQTVT